MITEEQFAQALDNYIYVNGEDALKEYVGKTLSESKGILKKYRSRKEYRIVKDKIKIIVKAYKAIQKDYNCAYMMLCNLNQHISNVDFVSAFYNYLEGPKKQPMFCLFRTPKFKSRR